MFWIPGIELLISYSTCHNLHCKRVTFRPIEYIVSYLWLDLCINGLQICFAMLLIKWLELKRSELAGDRTLSVEKQIPSACQDHEELIFFNHFAQHGSNTL